MEKEKVVLLKCSEYSLDLVKSKIKEALDLLCFFDKVKENDKVFIKLNCVGPFEKERGITTHPIFVKAIIQLLKEKTKNIIVGDNPAIKDQIFVLKKTGIYEVLQSENVKILDNKILTTIKNPNSKVYSTFEVSKEMIEADVFINLPKLKTHTLAYMTVAQKNYFGLVYGLNKSGWHVKAPNPLEFGEAINDLYGAFLESFKDKVVINICDGILALEGEGPSSGGISKWANVILASNDAISLDRIALEIAHLDYSKLFINIIGGKRKLGINDINCIEILGNSIDDFKDLTLLAPKEALSNFGLKFLRFKPLRNIMLEHPKIDKNKCIKCGQCSSICPPKAMTIKNKDFPNLTQNKCIRCWCCTEVCPQNAISRSSRPLVGKIVFKGKN